MWQGFKELCSILWKDFCAKPPTILFLGLAGSGKSAIIEKLETNRTLLSYTPTKHPVVIPFGFHKENYTLVDLGGSILLSEWDNYLDKCKGIVFVVDVSEPNEERLEDANIIFKYIRSQINGVVPIILLGSKKDLITEDEKSVEQRLIKVFGPYVVTKLCTIMDYKTVEDGFGLLADIIHPK